VESNMPAPATPATPAAPAATTSSDERTWAMFVHLAAFSAALGVPLGNVVGPLVVWQVKKKEMPGLEAHAKEAMNFHISMLIYGIVSAVLILVVVGLALVLVVGITSIVCTILAALKANDGGFYRYPLTLRLIK
jgi:uncharacterized Tic20 family protein